MYLAFNWFTLQIIFCHGRVLFSRNWLEGTCYLLVQEFCSALSGVSATASTHLVSPTAVPELNGNRAQSFFGIRSARPLTATSVLKTKFFIPISSDEKGTTSGTKASANHWLLLPPHPQPVVLLNDLHSLLRPTRSWSAGSLTLFWLPLAVSRCAC